MATNLKRVIGRMDSLDELRALKQAISAREKLLADRRYAESCLAAWGRVKDWKVGDTLHVCASGTFIGGSFQRGDSFMLTDIQPKAKRIWVMRDSSKLKHWFNAQGILRYDLRTTAPQNPLDPAHRQSIDRIGQRLFGNAS